MGYRVHHTIVVTGLFGWPYPKPEDAHTKAVEIFGDLVTPIIKSPVNGIGTFFVAPCGSNVGWEDFEEFEQKRMSFKDWLRISVSRMAQVRSNGRKSNMATMMAST